MRSHHLNAAPQFVVNFACSSRPPVSSPYRRNFLRRNIHEESILLTLSVVAACLVAVSPNSARAQGGFEQVSGDAFNHAVPTDFYLEGEHPPVEKRNAALLKTNKGARVVVGLIDTTGYSSQFQQKYIGMLISEARISVCGNSIGVGSYGLGLDRPAAPSSADAKFMLYNRPAKRSPSAA